MDIDLSDDVDVWVPLESDFVTDVEVTRSRKQYRAPLRLSDLSTFSVVTLLRHRLM